MLVTLVAHGSPDARHARDVGGLVERLQARGVEARAAYLDHDAPTPAQVARSMRAEGVEATIVVPLLVAPAYHVRVDVPAAVASMRRAAPGLAVAAADPVGTHPLLIAAAAELLERSELTLTPRTGVVVAFTGSRDRHAVAPLAELVGTNKAAMVERLGVRSVRAACLDGGRPLGRVRTLLRCVDGCRDVVAVTAMIADGVLRDRIVTSAGLADVPVAPGTLAQTSALAELVILRAESAPLPTVDPRAPQHSAAR